MKTSILLLLLTISCVAAKVFNQDPNTFACCGSTTYDQSNSFCCFGVVVSNSNGQFSDCCGTSGLSSSKSCCGKDDQVARSSDRSYDSAKQTCCDGSVLTSDVNRPDCCGSSLTNDGTDLCCDNTRFANAISNNKDCCGTSSSTYDLTKDNCCTDDATGKSVNNPGANTAGKTDCCGTVAFDNTKAVCCGGTVSFIASGDDVGSYDCCGKVAFNVNNKFCCGSTIFSPATGKTVTDYDCCDSKSFLVATQQCCGTSVQPSANSCCGSSSTTSSQLCCQGSVRNQNSDQSLSCCGSGTYNPNTQICCPDTEFANARAISTSSNGNTQCCGTSSYNSATQTCCSKDDGSNRVSGDLTKTECCGDLTAYDPSTHSCPCGKVISLSEDLENDENAQADCCGSTQYNAYTDYCCVATNWDGTKTTSPRLVNDLPGVIGFGCCYNDTSITYNPGYQTCCEYKSKSGRVVKAVCGTSCCQENSKSKPKGYFAGYQACCNGRVNDIASDDLGFASHGYTCCGTGVYNTNFYGCCNDADVYDADNQLCC